MDSVRQSAVDGDHLVLQTTPGRLAEPRLVHGQHHCLRRRQSVEYGRSTRRIRPRTSSTAAQRQELRENPPISSGKAEQSLRRDKRQLPEERSDLRCVAVVSDVSTWCRTRRAAFRTAHTSIGTRLHLSVFEELRRRFTDKVPRNTHRRQENHGHPCIASETNVADGIELDAELTQCKGCLRFQPRGKGQQNSSVSGAWLDCDWESAELMALCLKSVHGLQKAKLMDAGFIWTEPHSKRVKVKLTLQREVLNHAVIQNSCVVTYTVKSVQCPDCMKKYHNNTWRSLVQIRQKADHKRTFLRLEQVILKHKAHQNAIGIATVKEGMDFYFGTKSTAEKFIHFLTAHVPMRSKSSSKLISENVHNATANLQTTYSIELSPICRDDLLILPKKFAQSCGNISPIVLCARTTATIHLVDPRTGQKGEFSCDKYWKVPFLPLETSPAMVEFIVLDVEPVDERDYKNKSQQHQHQDSKFVVADVEVARASDFGVNDTTFIIRTHLGALLQAGDTVKGYDLTTSNFGTRHMYSLKEDELPDIVLVRKVYPREAQAGKKEKKLKTLGTFRRAKISKSEQARLEKELDAFTEEYLEELEEEREDGDDYVELDDDSDYDGEDDDEDEKDQEEDLGYTQTIEVLSLE